MRVLNAVGLGVAIYVLEVMAQPEAPTGPDLPCTPSEGTEEVLIPDTSGFIRIFNGKDFTGWWNNCQTQDAVADRAQGGIFRVDTVHKAIYSQQRPNGGASMLATNKKWTNYELILEVWPSWGNDAGLFHRATRTGHAFQTDIAYKKNNCVGGTYPQELEDRGSLFFNCAYFFGEDGSTLKQGTGNANVDYRTFKWDEMWDTAGWNELRVLFWGEPPSHQVFLRKPGGNPWTMVTMAKWPAIYSSQWPGTDGGNSTGFIALQIHFGGYWNKNGKGTWYRNIRVRPMPWLDVIPDHAGPPSPRAIPTLTMEGKVLQGWLDKAYSITVRDIHGRLHARFMSKPGAVRHAFASTLPAGILLVELEAGEARRDIRILAP